MHSAVVSKSRVRRDEPRNAQFYPSYNRSLERDVRGLIVGHEVGSITLLLAVAIPSESQAESGRVKLGCARP